MKAPVTHVGKGMAQGKFMTDIYNEGLSLKAENLTLTDRLQPDPGSVGRACGTWKIQTHHFLICIRKGREYSVALLEMCKLNGF